ncbi:MAG: hypothetical protein NZL95_05770 [Chitinophagales bacterium]|nr:hypothetical protein [Chitinophagales bacterium]MDW8428042.1 hypothetical protein [Chitinophagales bacterium]
MNSWNLIDFVKIVWKWRKPIALVVGLAALGSVILTDPRIMPPKYRSSTLFYPLNPNLASSGALFGGTGDYLFGGTADIDRVMSVANSVPLKMYIVEKFNLYEHYRIDTTKTNYPTYTVIKKLDAHYQVEKTPKGAIQISVEDRDRYRAAEMANAIVERIDQINRELINENKKKILEIYRRKMEDKEIVVQQLTDSIFALKSAYGLYTDIEDLAHQERKLQGPKGPEVDAAMERVKVLEEKKKGAVRELNNSITQYEQHLATIDADIPTILVLEKAFPAERKSKPIRWLILVATVLLSFTVMAVTAVVIERYAEFRKIFTA